ncbi:aldolase/citrate lyase family protein [Sphingobium fuliginis]|nr:aldolase/citrate lyase family protein [Sphingobium fuliginis]
MPKLILSQPSADMDMMAAFVKAGWSDVMLDLEHSLHGEADVKRALVAVEHAGGTLHVKMADRNPNACGRLFFQGVRSFIIPQVEDAATINAVHDELTRYDFLDTAEIQLSALVESGAAVERIPDICAVQGLTAVHVGLIDFALDLGFEYRGRAHFETLGPRLAPHLLDALDTIRACGKAAGCALLPGWFATFPLERLDQVTVPLGDLLDFAHAAAVKGRFTQ